MKKSFKKIIILGFLILTHNAFCAQSVTKVSDEETEVDINEVQAKLKNAFSPNMLDIDSYDIKNVDTIIELIKQTKIIIRNKISTLFHVKPQLKTQETLTKIIDNFKDKHTVKFISKYIAICDQAEEAFKALSLQRKERMATEIFNNVLAQVAVEMAARYLKCDCTIL